MSKMDILMLNYEFPPLGGGASPITYHLSRELVKLGVNVDVVTMGYKGLKRFEEIDGINVYRVPCIRSKKEICHTREMLSYDISALFLLLKLMKERKYDLNHTHFIIPCGGVSYLLKKSKDLPYIITSHGSDVPGYNPDRFSFTHRFASPFWEKIVQNSERVITPSNYLKNLILDKMQTNKIKVIPHGFNYTEFEPKEKEKRILVVSRLFERKGVQYFLNAIKDLESDYEVVIVGEGPYKEKLLQKALDVKIDVKFVGWLDNTSEDYKNLYETSSIFVFPSSQESFGVVLQEAMSAKMAIITSNSSGCVETVGDAALLVRPKNSQDLKKALVSLIENDDLRKQLAKKGRERVEKEFSWKRIARQYLDLYEAVAS
ncbi:MAG: glycosyltransferase family 4 protein [Candidatus Hydrothermarchaeales archaeon]